MQPSELLQALTLLYLEVANYITVNNLGETHHNFSMRQAKEAIENAEEFDEESLKDGLRKNPTHLERRLWRALERIADCKEDDPESFAAMKLEQVGAKHGYKPDLKWALEKYYNAAVEKLEVDGPDQMVTCRPCLMGSHCGGGVLGYKPAKDHISKRRLICNCAWCMGGKYA